MTTITEVLHQSYHELFNHNIKTAKIDSELILANLLKISRIDLITKQNLNLSKDKIDLYNNLLERRKKKEPVAYIFNKREFWNENYYVD